MAFGGPNMCLRERHRASHGDVRTALVGDGLRRHGWVQWRWVVNHTMRVCWSVLTPSVLCSEGELPNKKLAKGTLASLPTLRQCFSFARMLSCTCEQIWILKLSLKTSCVIWNFQFLSQTYCLEIEMQDIDATSFNTNIRSKALAVQEKHPIIKAIHNKKVLFWVLLWCS